MTIETRRQELAAERLKLEEEELKVRQERLSLERDEISFRRRVLDFQICCVPRVRFLLPFFRCSCYLLDLTTKHETEGRGP